ncbi:hypothetical protein Taro_026783 [Colocasia esculenta]|uniref:Uncharacterized protein n=1 Tax=Colocasia esculenta TaxID=4460 RepID=A0A843VKL4_COLES|nr:hypothetical protein [Colocasia esculenta]
MVCGARSGSSSRRRLSSGRAFLCGLRLGSVYASSSYSSRFGSVYASSSYGSREFIDSRILTSDEVWSRSELYSQQMTEKYVGEEE